MPSDGRFGSRLKKHRQYRPPRTDFVHLYPFLRSCQGPSSVSKKVLDRGPWPAPSTVLGRGPRRRDSQYPLTESSPLVRPLASHGKSNFLHSHNLFNRWLKWVILIHWCVKNESFQDNILRIKRKLIKRKKVEILQNQDFTIKIKQFDWMVNWSGQVEIHAEKTWFLQNTKNHKLLKIGWLMT